MSDDVVDAEIVDDDLPVLVYDYDDQGDDDGTDGVDDGTDGVDDPAWYDTDPEQLDDAEIEYSDTAGDGGPTYTTGGGGGAGGGKPKAGGFSSGGSSGGGFTLLKLSLFSNASVIKSTEPGTDPDHGPLRRRRAEESPSGPLTKGSAQRGWAGRSSARGGSTKP